MPGTQPQGLCTYSSGYFHPSTHIAFSFPSFRFNSKVNFTVRPFLTTVSKNLTFCPLQSPNYTPCFPILFLSTLVTIWHTIYLFTQCILTPTGMQTPCRQTLLSGTFTTTSPAPSPWYMEGAQEIHIRDREEKRENEGMERETPLLKNSSRKFIKSA